MRDCKTMRSKIGFILRMFSILAILVTSNAVSIHIPRANIASELDSVETEQTSPTLTIFHVNDLHAQVRAQDGIGSIATMFALMKAYGYNENSDSSILLDAGDYNSGGALGSLSRGEAMIDIMNAMGVDASALGNHEFDHGVEWIEKRNAKAKFDAISANIFEKDTDNPVNFTKPWVVLDRDGIKVGIIGLTQKIDHAKVVAA